MCGCRGPHDQNQFRSHFGSNVLDALDVRVLGAMWKLHQWRTAVLLRYARRAVLVPLVLQSTAIMQIVLLSNGRCETTNCTSVGLDIAGIIKDKENAVLPRRGPGPTPT